MPFEVDLETARAEFQQYEFVAALAPSEQKAAFHVKDGNGNDLCLKIINPNARIEYLQREILALQAINHPNIARLKEYSYSSKHGEVKHYIVEEFIQGKDLSEELHDSDGWTRSKASIFFAELCDGLSALREKNIVHRDLKPSNIRVRPSGSPVIIDFGVARHLDLPDITSTSNGAAIGTPRYFAPEQFIGTKHDIKHQTDLFAVGILIYEALVGQHPFVQNGVSLSEAICTSHGYRNAQKFRDLPQEWKLIIGRLLGKNKADRPHDASQVASILRKIGGI